jgi:hypothetical protein
MFTYGVIDDSIDWSILQVYDIISLIHCKFTLMLPRISSQHSLYQPLDQVPDNIEDKPALGQPLVSLVIMARS